MNEFVFTTMRCVFVCFLEEIEDTQKTFRNYLTFILIQLKKYETDPQFLQFSQNLMTNHLLTCVFCTKHKTQI